MSGISRVPVAPGRHQTDRNQYANTRGFDLIQFFPQRLDQDRGTGVKYRLVADPLHEKFRMFSVPFLQCLGGWQRVERALRDSVHLRFQENARARRALGRYRAAKTGIYLAVTNSVLSWSAGVKPRCGGAIQYEGIPVLDTGMPL